ncbi:MAG: hypothetical protein R2849_19725 [Thermomicrobiales bacterium]
MEQSFIPTDEDAFPGDPSLDLRAGHLDRGQSPCSRPRCLRLLDEPGLRSISRRNSPATPCIEETDLDAAGIDGAEKADRALLDGFAQIDDALLHRPATYEPGYP